MSAPEMTRGGFLFRLGALVGLAFGGLLGLAAGFALGRFL